MKYSCLKLKNDGKSFKIFKAFGFDVFEIDKAEAVDSKLQELIKNDYKTIVISNELSCFSRRYYKKIW